MRNRAKCKLCNAIIESIQEKDTVTCTCGEISVFGGELMMCTSRNWINFLRVDDEGNTIVPKVVDAPNIRDMPQKPSKEELLKMIDDLIGNIDSLPKQAMTVSINHYDYYTLLVLLSSIFTEIFPLLPKKD